MRRRLKILPALAVLALLIALASGELRIREGTSNTISGSKLNAGSLGVDDLSGVSPVKFPTSK
jgi:hypothetical protein